MDKIAISVLGNIFGDEGTTVRSKRIAGILKNKYEVTIITRANENRMIKDNINIEVVKPEKTKLWNIKLIKIIFKNNFNFIYCSNDWFGFLTYYFFSFVYKYKIIFEAHAILSEESKESKQNKFKIKFFEQLEKFVAKKSDYFISLSGNNFEFYKKYSKKIELIPNFIDDEKFKNLKYNKTNSPKKTVGLIGPFNTTANLHFLHFLYKYINKFDSRIEFNIIGKCEYMIESSKISYTGYIDEYDEYIKEITSLDAVIIPSKYMTSGPLTKIIESMACSIPVFTTPTGIIGLDKIENGKDILVFEEDDLIENLNINLFNKKLMDKIAINAKMTILKYYSQKSNKNRLIHVFNELGGK